MGSKGLPVQVLLGLKFGVWTDSWRGAGSPPGHYIGAPEQGTKPRLGATDYMYVSSSLALTFLHCMCLWVLFVFICNMGLCMVKKLQQSEKCSFPWGTNKVCLLPL